MSLPRCPLRDRFAGAGASSSHTRIAASPDALHLVRIYRSGAREDAQQASGEQPVRTASRVAFSHGKGFLE
jgi:hypothetical protein